MDQLNQMTLLGAGGRRRQASGNYIATANLSFSPAFTLLDHTTPGVLTYASAYNVFPASGAPSPDVAFSPDGAYLAAHRGSTANALDLLSRPTPGTLALAATFTSPLGRLAFTPNGEYIIGQGNIAWLYAVHRPTPTTFNLTSTLNTTYTIQATSISPDGNYIAVGLAEASFNSHRVLLIQNNAGTLSLSATYTTAGQVYGVAFSPDGNYIAAATAADPYFVLLRRPTAGSLQFQTSYSLTTQTPGQSVAFSPLGNYIAFGHGNLITLLSRPTAETVAFSSVTANINPFTRIQFSPDGTYLAGAIQQTSSQQVRLFDILSTPGVLTQVADYSLFTGSSPVMTGLSFSPN